jgi:hypothetical protein
MAKLKKYPKPPKRGKKPKANASVASKEKFLQRCKDQDKTYSSKCAEVDKHNAQVQSDAKKSLKLQAQIGSVGRVAPKRKK